jgi:internalin A
VATLSPGNYVADVFINAHFAIAEIERPQHILITIFDTSQVVVMKPNIYLYPRTTRNLSVALEFPLGGSILQSIPSYSTGWNVSVEPSGKINQQYDYLFYESKNPDMYQYQSGWVVSRDTLTSFFTNNLLLAGFSEREKDDFIEYWIPRLIDYPYYIIYPQFADEIGKTIQLKISEPPDTMLRLFYIIKGTTNMDQTLSVPTIPQFKRNGFVVTEWGVVLK